MKIMKRKSGSGNNEKTKILKTNVENWHRTEKIDSNSSNRIEIQNALIKMKNNEDSWDDGVVAEAINNSMVNNKWKKCNAFST